MIPEVSRSRRCTRPGRVLPPSGGSPTPTISVNCLTRSSTTVGPTTESPPWTEIPGGLLITMISTDLRLFRNLAEVFFFHEDKTQNPLRDQAYHKCDKYYRPCHNELGSWRRVQKGRDTKREDTRRLAEKYVCRVFNHPLDEYELPEAEHEKRQRDDLAKQDRCELAEKPDAINAIEHLPAETRRRG